MHFISADQIHNGKKFLEKGSVLIMDDRGRIEDLIRLEYIDQNKVQFYEGILCPGFINTHCHLELSHLKDKIPMHTGLVDFALGIMKNRSVFSVEEIKEFAQEADKHMRLNGIVAVGDICNTNHTLDTKLNSEIHYHSFIELIGLNPGRAGHIFLDGITLRDEFLSAGLTASFAPHAPYSVSYKLMEMIAGQKAIASIHNQESEQENLFFKHKTGDFLKLYNAINVPIDYYEASGRSSIQSYLSHLKSAHNLLLVHNTFSSKEDIAFAEGVSGKLSWCLCPNANLYIEKAMPEIDLLISQGSRICLGTDSLASNHSLSIADEIQTISNHFPKIPMETLITWGTYNGAAFLGIDDRLGTIEKQKAPGINHLVQKAGRTVVQKVF